MHRSIPSLPCPAICRRRMQRSRCGAHLQPVALIPAALLDQHLGAANLHNGVLVRGGLGHGRGGSLRGGGCRCTKSTDQNTTIFTKGLNDSLMRAIFHVYTVCFPRRAASFPPSSHSRTMLLKLLRGELFHVPEFEIHPYLTP